MKRGWIKSVTATLAGLMLLGQTCFATEYTLVEFNSPTAGRNLNIPVSSAKAKEGAFSLKWSDGNIYRPISLGIKKRDYSNGTFKMWMYSANATKSDFYFLMVSDNPETPELDGYRDDFWNYWIGWKQMKFQVDPLEVTEVGKPMGYDNIDQIVLMPILTADSPRMGTELYLNQISFEKNETE